VVFWKQLSATSIYIKLIHAVRQSSEVASWAIQMIENQYANEINSIVFVADRIADMFENGIIRDLVDKVKDDLTFFVSFRIFFSDNTRVRIFIFFLEIFFQNLTLDYMTKTLNQIIFSSSTKIRIFFSATLGIRIFFQKKNHNPPPPSS
jgi:hypothetical protein